MLKLYVYNFNIMEPIEFQIYDWQEDHEKDEELDSDSEDSDKKSDDIGTYIIHIFGRTLEGKSVYTKLVNYTPHFYIRLPLNWSKEEAKSNIKKMYNYFVSDANKKVWNKFRTSLIGMDMVERMSAEGFTNGKKYLFARLVFNNMISMKKYKFMFEESTIYIPGVTQKSIQFKTYEANLPPMLRCFHIKKISGCSWVKVNKYLLIDDNSKDSYCEIELRVDWRDIEPIIKDVNAPFRIASFDIECYTADANKFPEAKNKSDCIFQIGTTYTYIGMLEPYRQHIVCLRETNQLDNIIVEWYKTESEMVMAWIKEIIAQDVDIITGYNIFGFDEAYIYNRCISHLNMEQEIGRLSKLKYYNCKFREFKLESSALGQNNIRMFDTPGRIHIDLMKDIQKNHKLNSYKLDFVASNFIRNEIYNIEKIDDKLKLWCDGVDNISTEDYIHFEYVLDFISEMIGYKYKIEEIDKTNKTITIAASDETNEFMSEDDFNIWQNINYKDKEARKQRKFKLVWSQAKDDVGPRDIFRMFNEGPKERAIIAKYCVKDCKLVSLLIEKLSVVTNNIEMANVCYVPMSFLFTRGQVIKLFSLCLKYYREAGYLFPVLKKPEEKTPSYEGAIVFDPEANVEYEALAVKDYKSLYPSSMIHKNMSHETVVSNDKYDNLPDVKYYNASYKEADGSIVYRRFAQVDNKLGVVPQILNDLIAERDAVKKVMKKEKDPFKYKILDGKQLAVKVTANSLYGATGADTSPIRQRDIAACTTSTGREMLKLAKHFDENIIPGLLNGYRYALYDGDNDKADQILNLEMRDINDNELRERIKKYVTNDIKTLTFQPIIRYGDTDSIFSCYRFREEVKQIKDTAALPLWKDIIEFGKRLMSHFIPKDNIDLFRKLFDKYYDESYITELRVPKGPDYIPPPSHYNIVQPIEIRIEQFILHYMEESFMPWLWTIQDIFTKKYINKETRINSINMKVFNTGITMLEKMLLINDLNDDIKEIIVEDIEYFIENKLKTYIIQPYWDIVNNERIIRVRFYKHGKMITDKRTLVLSIEMGIITGELVKKRLPYPHDLEYEKTFWPFLILTKKRYVGNKYEEDPNKYKQDYNGIVLKRRDNAPIVKEICGGIINRLIDMRDPQLAKQYTIDCMNRMFNGEYNIKYFLTSKTLKMKESYADWTKIAHVVLADRIAQRDPGNCPQSGDRIEFAAVELPNATKTTLQGERIETPQYIKDNNLKIDCEFYMTNQIMNPALQFLSLAIPKAHEIFEEFKIKLENKKKGRTSILSFCKKC